MARFPVLRWVWTNSYYWMDHYPCCGTCAWSFGNYSVNPAWEGNSFNLMYCVYGKICTVYYSSTCSSAFVPTTCERLAQIIVWRACFLLAVVALPYDFPRPNYSSTKFTGSVQNKLPPSPWRFSVFMKVCRLLFESGECRLRWIMMAGYTVSVAYGLQTMAQASLEAILRGNSWPVSQAIRNTYDRVSGLASFKSTLTWFEEKTANLLGAGKPSWRWRKVILKRTGKFCQSVTRSGKVVQ